MLTTSAPTPWMLQNRASCTQVITPSLCHSYDLKPGHAAAILCGRLLLPLLHSVCSLSVQHLAAVSRPACKRGQLAQLGGGLHVPSQLHQHSIVRPARPARQQYATLVNGMPSPYMMYPATQLPQNKRFRRAASNAYTSHPVRPCGPAMRRAAAPRRAPAATPFPRLHARAPLEATAARRHRRAPRPRISR